MGTAHCLHDVMNEVSRNLEAVLSAPVRISAGDELAAFATQDDLLADLRKQYTDAKEHHRCALKEYGVHDGMTEIAMLLEDSAWCAMQTRYMELRSNRMMMKRVQAMLEEARAEEERLEKIEKERDALEMWKTIHYMSGMKKKKESDPSLLWLFTLFFTNSGMPMFREQTSYSFNRLAA